MPSKTNTDQSRPLNNKHPSEPNADELCVWVITDGKVGDDVQCLAIAGALAPSFKKHVVNPRTPYIWFMPWGGIDPRDHPKREASPIKPPYPDVVIASGRRAIPYALKVKSESKGRTLTVIMKDPRIKSGKADFIWAPAHDKLKGPTVFTTFTSPHGLTGKLEAARLTPIDEIAALPRPMLGVLLGGPGGGVRYDEKTIAALAQMINEAGAAFASIAITPSRRTADDMVGEITKAIEHDCVYSWRREGKNPYTDIIANSDALVATADSHNMMSEALAAGVGVYAFRPPGLPKKLSWFADEMEDAGAVRKFSGQVDMFTQAPIDATADIVVAIKAKLEI